MQAASLDVQQLALVRTCYSPWGMLPDLMLVWCFESFFFQDCPASSGVSNLFCLHFLFSFPFLSSLCLYSSQGHNLFLIPLIDNARHAILCNQDYFCSTIYRHSICVVTTLSGTLFLRGWRLAAACVTFPVARVLLYL